MSYASEHLTKVETLKALLVCASTGGPKDGFGYIGLRTWLLADPELKPLAPSWLRSHRNLDEFWSLVKGKFAHYDERRQWLREEFEPLIDKLESAQAFPSDASTTTQLEKHGMAYIREAWAKALTRRELDPEGAITSARTLLEEVCRHVLDEANVPYDPKDDLPKLYGLTSKQLNLAPSQHTEDVFKQICEELFVALAARSPRGLASLLTTEGLLDNAELSLAAEAFGRAEDLTLVRQTLVSLLKHKSALVREGAIYGLAELGFEDVRVAIEATAKGDAHAGVRRAAGAVLAGWQEQSRD